MGQKRETLLRWVNCCCEVTSGTAHIEKIQCLSNGNFFLQVLDYLRTSPGGVTDPWSQIREILKIPELKLDNDIVDFDSASCGSEEELSKLIAVCMYLTMVKKPDERIKENTISNFSMEDQRIIETILVAILNEDSLSRSKLVELLQEPQESQPSRSIVFYTSSPLSSVTRSSPLKRFLDSPMALRLTRLQKEIHDKNEEIRRLQAEIVAESDETSILKQRMEEVQRKVKQLEKNNTELRQRLRDSQSPDHSGLSANAELTKMRKQLKKLQDDYEATTQRYCDLNIAHDALKNQKEKDRKQIRQLQLDLNEAVAKFDRESADMQLLLDSIRTENVEIKHSLDEKMQWIEVLEEKNQMCSETHARSFVPKSPSEKDSIGFSLLSIESEKLKQELDNNRREMIQQSDKFDSQKILFEEQLNSLIQENKLLSQSLEASQKELTESSLTLLKLEQEYLKLKEDHECSEKQFTIQLQTTSRNLELVSSKVSELVLLNSSTQSQLESVTHEKLAYGNRCSELEVKHNQLSSEHDLLQERLSQLISNSQLTQAEFQKEKNVIVAELELKTRQLAEQESSMESMTTKYDEAQQQINTLSSSIEFLEHNIVELQTSRSSLEQELSVLQTLLASVKLELQTTIDEAKIDASEKEILLTQKTEAIHSIELTLKEITSKEIELKSQLSAVANEKSQLLKENNSLQTELSRLVVLQEESEKQCKELVESEKKLIHNYTHQIKEIKQQFDESVNEQNALQNKIQILVVELQGAQKKEELLINAQRMHQEDFDRRFGEQTKEHNHQLKQLSTELSNSQQMHKDVEKKYEEAESSLHRSDQEANTLRQQLLEQSDTLKQLENVINTLRVENEAVGTQCADRLQTLESEKSTLLELQANMEEQLNEKVKALHHAEILRKDAEKEKQLLVCSIDKLQLDFKTVQKEKCFLATQLSNLQNSHTIAVDELERLRVDFKATEIHLSDTNQSVRNLELQTEQLTTEIQELSNKKGNLELLASQLQDSLETTKAMAVAAEVESNKQRDLHQEQSVQIKNLSTTVEVTERKLVGIQLENNSLRTKMLDLEDTNRELMSTISSLKSDSEVERQKLSVDLNDSKAAQERLHQSMSETLQSISTLQRQLDERDEALNRVTKELDLEKNRSSSAQTAFIETLTKFREEKKTVLQSEIEVLNSEIVDLKCGIKEKDSRLKECATQLKNVQLQLDSSTTINQKMDEECIRLKADLFQLSQTKETEILEMRNKIDQANAQLKELADQKQALEIEFVELKRSIESSTSYLKQENQQMKSELVAEKEKAVLIKSETALEHRKEKAALEARLQLAMTQVKSMQEKLVAMTVANQAQAPLENKITSLTSELQAVCKTNTELEKKLQQATDGSENEVGSTKKEQAKDCETDGLRKKYESVKKTLNLKEDVINQFAAQFEKMQSRLETQNEEVVSLNAEKKKLLFENRSLKTEQQHLLAQISAEKDKATLRNTRHSLALQRGTSASEVEAVSGVRSRTLRASRSEACTGMASSSNEVFKAPALATSDFSGKSIFKIPSARRESTSSVCSSRSDASNTSRINVPQGAGKFFTCDDEDGELFSSQFLNEMKEGTCNLEDLNIRRMSELHRRNTLQPPHMRSAYPTELNDERLRRVDAPLQNIPSDAPNSEIQDESQNENIQRLSIATSLLSMNTPPAMNTRKRRSSSWNQSDIETPVMLPRKRRSYELEADLSSDSTDTRSISSSAERKKRRDAGLTTYQRPGPPTPGRNSTKENISTSSASSSPPKATPKNAVKAGSKRTTPSQSRSVKLTPASLVRKVQSKLRSSTKQTVNEQSTPDTTPRGRSMKDSKLNIFRKPLGSRGYINSDSKF